MFQDTRRRLAIWYTAVTAVLLLLFATGVYMYVRSTLIERVDDTLNHVVEVVQRSFVIESEPMGKLHVNVEASFRDNASTVEDDHIDLEWFSPTGELLWSTLSEPLNVPIHFTRIGETVHSSADHLLRQVTERVQVGRQVLGYLRVSHPWFEVTKPTRWLMVDLIFGIVLMIISVAASGWWLSGLAMEPVRESYQRLKQFTADASHELRNPIAMIQTNVQVALADPDPDPQSQRQQLKVVERLTRRLGRLVNDLLFLARSDSGMSQDNWVPVPLDALLMEVIEEQQLIAAKKGIKLSLNLVETLSAEFEFSISVNAVGESVLLGLKSADSQSETAQSDQQLHYLPSKIGNPQLDEDAFTVQGDWDQLARLFTNLVSNALQYTPSAEETGYSAAVEVELQRIEGRGTARRYGTPQLRVVVRDPGMGIPESALPHIFDRFYRVDPARSRNPDLVSTKTGGVSTTAGSGLGLAIAQVIVENHQGHIQIESVLYQGTTVTVTLPAPRQETLS